MRTILDVDGRGQINCAQGAAASSLPLRVMHWINAIAIFIMIGSGWRIYNDDVLFAWLDFLTFW